MKKGQTLRMKIRMERFLGRKPKNRSEYQKIWKYLKDQEPLWKKNKMEYDRCYQRERYMALKSNTL